MRKIYLTIFSVLTFFLLVPKITAAIYDPFTVSNNRYGIHIMDENDLTDAANLVNSSGGDWGYVTIVIPKTDRNHDKWQKIFDKMRRLHLIPLIRVATQLDSNSNWEKPNFDEIDGWVGFFNSLNWVIKNRYVIIANEPNQAKEWGGEIDPEGYAKYLSEFSQKLKKSSDDYFVLPAGLDASAPDTPSWVKSPQTMNETTFLKRMLAFDPNVFDNVDGWTSHSYPNPAFSGSEKDSGKGSVKTFDWELAYLKRLEVNKNLPVFITEAGWTHSMNGQNKHLIPTENVGAKLSFAFQNVWNDTRIVAVTPFLLNYLEPPFDIFSWKDKNGQYYSFYNDVRALAKTGGDPEQETSGEILAHVFSKMSVLRIFSGGIILVKNTGQSIWNINDIQVTLNGNEHAEILKTSFNSLEPFSLGFIIFKNKPPETGGLILNTLEITYKGHKIGHTVNYHTISIKLPSVHF